LTRVRRLDRFWGLSLHVAYITSEIAPYVKTGGLADVSAALPKALARLGHKVTVLAPLYRGISRSGMELRGSVHVPMGGELQGATFHATRAGDVEVVFVENAPYFDRPFPYGVASSDYPDNNLRFAFFARAALEYFRSRAQRPDVVHAHDWQAGLAPVYMKTRYWDDPTLGRVPSVFTIHNLAYQGRFALDTLRQFDLPWHLGTPEGIEFHDSICYMKGGVLFSELLSTVSPQYAQEIQTPEHGYHFDGLLRARRDDLVGILNGVDYDEWDPRHDPHIARMYSRDLKGKAADKDDLLRAFDLPVKPALPLVGILSRLVYQKGFDVVARAWFDFVQRPMRMVVVGTGDKDVQDGFVQLVSKAPDRFAVRFVYDAVLAHKLVAGADMLLMPSRYEPCGLTQMYALRYGTVPVVRSTGGLVDTVDPYDPATGSGTGFRFAHPDGTGMMWAIDQAIATYGDKKAWPQLQQNGMDRDFSWDRSAESYVDLYKEAARRV
jgi:starch synthase